MLWIVLIKLNSKKLKVFFFTNDIIYALRTFILTDPPRPILKPFATYTVCMPLTSKNKHITFFSYLVCRKKKFLWNVALDWIKWLSQDSDCINNTRNKNLKCLFSALMQWYPLAYLLMNISFQTIICS